MISALSEYAGCLADAQTAYSSCIETCTGRSLPLKNACVRKCSRDNLKDVAKCESDFEDPPDGKPWAQVRKLEDQRMTKRKCYLIVAALWLSAVMMSYPWLVFLVWFADAVLGLE